MTIFEAAEKLKNEIRDDFGVYDVFTANRFGTETIVVGYVAPEDCQRIAKKIPEQYEGYYTHINGPIWGVGGLVPENKEKFLMLLQGEHHVAHGKLKDVRLDQFGKIAEEEDLAIWNKWTIDERKKWLRDYILEQREKKPTFGNCADKFLD